LDQRDVAGRRASGSSGVYVRGPTWTGRGRPPTDGALAEQFGRVGLWTRHLDVQPAKQVREAIAELEELG
jgi:hypothetical protein